MQSVGATLEQIAEQAGEPHEARCVEVGVELLVDSQFS